MRRLIALLSAFVLALASAPAALAFAPTNDEQAGATVITVTADVPFATTQDTTEATINATDPQRAGPYIGDPSIAIGPSVWYVYTAAETGTIVVDVTGSSYVPSLVMFDNNLTYMNNTFDVVVPDVIAGETYYFVVGDEDESDGLGGTLSLTIATVPPEPIPVEAQIGVTGASIVDGQLVVTGTLNATGEYRSSTLVVDATQKGKAAPTGSGFINDPGTGWTVSLPASTTWRAARTSVTVRVMYFVDPDEYADWDYTQVAAVQATQAAPEPTPEPGSVSGRFTLTDNETGEATSVVVNVVQTHTDAGELTTGQLVIRSGRFAGTYEPYQIGFGIDAGYPAASMLVLMPNGHILSTYMFTTAEGSQMAYLVAWDSDGSTLLDQMVGTVTKKSYTIVVPVP